MTIQVTTDHNIEGSERLINHVTDVLNTAFGRYSEHITTLIVHFTDENGSKSGPDDKRCVIEARIERQQPIAATSHASTTEQAVKLAIEKVKHSIDTIIGKQRDHNHAVKDDLINIE